jgi:hypothetical protein
MLDVKNAFGLVREREIIDEKKRTTITTTARSQQ